MGVGSGLGLEVPVDPPFPSWSVSSPMGSSFAGAGWPSPSGASVGGGCGTLPEGSSAGSTVARWRPPDVLRVPLSPGFSLSGACAVEPDGVEPDGVGTDGVDGVGTVKSAGVRAKIRGMSVIPDPPQIGQACCAAASMSRRTRAAWTSSSRASSGTCGSSAVSWSRLRAVKSRSSETEAWLSLSA